MPSAAAATLADLARALDGLAVRWYVFGAQAAIHYGSPRATADVDVTVELGNHGVAEVLAALAEGGIQSRIPFDAAFVARTRVLPMVHAATRMGVDVVLAGPGPEETFLARAIPTSVEGVPVRMVSPTDLVVMKVLAGRPKDIDDVVGVLRARPPGLDTGEARRMLQELEAMLDQSDLAPALDAALARVAR